LPLFWISGFAQRIARQTSTLVSILPDPLPLHHEKAYIPRFIPVRIASYSKPGTSGVSDVLVTRGVVGGGACRLV